MDTTYIHMCTYIHTSARTHTHTRSQAHQDAVWALAVHPSESVLFSASADATVAVWQLPPDDPLAGGVHVCGCVRLYASE